MMKNTSESQQPAALWDRLFILTERIGAVLDAPDGEVNTGLLDSILADRQECMEQLNSVEMTGETLMDQNLRDLIRRTIELDTENQEKANRILNNAREQLQAVRQTRKAVRTYRRKPQRDEGAFIDNRT